MSFWQSPSAEHKRLRAEDAAAARSARLHMARDVNDQRTLAEVPVAIKRHGKLNWLLLAVIVVALGFAATGIFSRDIQLDVTANCNTAAVTFSKTSYPPKDDMVFRATGPAGGTYRIVLRDATGGTARLSPDFAMDSCLSETFAYSAPLPGEYAVKLLKIDGDIESELSSTPIVIA